MAQIDSSTKFLGVDSTKVSLKERKDNINNAKTEYYGIEEIATAIGPGPQGPQGIQGVQGPAGPIGPVGPAGLNWQGQWVSGTSYVEDDAVGYDGASWFCILATDGTTPPDEDTTHWALLASQGAQGIQGEPGAQGPIGPQGPAGGEFSKTQGAIFSSVNQTEPTNVLVNDINVVTGNNGTNVRLPDNQPVGKEIIVQYNGINPQHVINVRTFDLSTKISINSSSSASNGHQVRSYETIRYIAKAGGFWVAEFITGRTIRFNSADIDISNFNIVESILNLTTEEFTLSQLNTLYPDVFGRTNLGLKIVCPNILTGGIMYIKTGLNTWVSTPITPVV